tara:strand:+ start:121 stop:414 length:294 start_codon:yes stop_codon:yes gene_type:complete
LATVKSELLKELKKSYPNFLTRDLNKVIDIIIEEIKEALNRNEGCEFRSFGSFRTNIQKASIRRNPKTGEKVSVPKKRTIKWKMSKDLFKKLNNEKE